MNSEYLLPIAYRVMQVIPVLALALAVVISLVVCILLLAKPALRRRRWVMGYNSIAEQFAPGRDRKRFAAPPAPPHLSPAYRLCFIDGQLAALKQLQKLKERQQRKLAKRRKK